MKKLTRVSNIGEGHLSLYFEADPESRDCTASYDGSMINLFEDENGNVVEIEVLFVEEPGRVINLMRVAALHDLDMSPLFSTYEGTLSTMKIADIRKKYESAS